MHSTIEFERCGTPLRRYITGFQLFVFFFLFNYRSIGSTTTGLGFDFDIGILSITVNMLIACRLLVGRGESYRNHVICFHCSSMDSFVWMQRGQSYCSRSRERHFQNGFRERENTVIITIGVLRMPDTVFSLFFCFFFSVFNNQMPCKW